MDAPDLLWFALPDCIVDVGRGRIPYIPREHYDDVSLSTLSPSSHHFLSPLPADEKAAYELQWTALEEQNSGSDNSELKYPVSTKIKSHMPSLEPKSANLLTS